MATLVLSTVGNVLGGPIGGAIGALIGQSIDQQIFGPGPRQGPRLNDLAVQTSSYGTAIPRIYGRMRVAGSVIWATDLQESSTLQSGGKNQPNVETFTYSVSMAVALSSRAASGIGRIWADGKLLRGEAGDFKVRTGFRFHPGDEDQAVDPLIASAEGIAETPAFRGLALAVFEDLELANYGNRIPFLTMEILADDSPPTIGAILTDASGGVIRSALATPLEGYGAHGASRRAAIEPLVEHFDVALRQREGQLETGPPTLFEMENDDLGCAPDGKSEARAERSIVPERATPTSLTIDYYDPARDYQAGRMRASAGGRAGQLEAVDLPIVIGAGAARAVAENSLARRWAQRERMTLRLPPQLLPVAPGDLVTLPGSGRRWTVRQVRLEAMIAIVELQAAWQVAPGVVADPGRPAPSRDIVAGPTQMALLDLPDLGGGAVLQLQLAAASSTEAWRQVPVEIAIGGAIRGAATAQVETLLGTSLTVLAPGESGVFDTVSSVDVALANDEQWLESRDDDALIMGANLAALGREIIQFGSAVAIAPGRFRLSRLLRGRFGSEWAMATHVIGEDFALLDSRALRAILLPDAMVGAEVQVTAHGVGDGAGTEVSAIAGGEALRPPSPAHLRTTLAGGALAISWVRRSRAGYSWVDEIDSPLGETSERYRVRVEGAAGIVEVETVAPFASFSAAELSAAGSGPATVSVAQVGDRALSRWTSLPITLP
jgi:hypothetical protein